jgi:hypothetical protein
MRGAWEPASTVIAQLDRANPPSIAERSRSNVDALQYWAIRWSLSSGGALRRPGGEW